MSDSSATTPRSPQNSGDLAILLQEQELRAKAQERAAQRAARRAAAQKAQEASRPPIDTQAALAVQSSFVAEFNSAMHDSSTALIQSIDLLSTRSTQRDTDSETAASGRDGDDDEDGVPELAEDTKLSMSVWMKEERQRCLSDIKMQIAAETEKLQADKDRRVLLESTTLEGDTALKSTFKAEDIHALATVGLPTKPEDEILEVPYWEGWVQKKGRSRVSAWRWRYMQLKDNCLFWWKTKQDFEASMPPWGYLDFNRLPPHVKREQRDNMLSKYSSVAVEMMGRSYRLTIPQNPDSSLYDSLVVALEAQEENTRKRNLQMQGDSLEDNLEQVGANYYNSTQ